MSSRTYADNIAGMTNGFVQAMIEAQSDGFGGPRIMERAKKLFDSGVYDDPPALRARMDTLERIMLDIKTEIRSVREALEELSTEVRNVGDKIPNYQSTTHQLRSAS